MVYIFGIKTNVFKKSNSMMSVLNYLKNEMNQVPRPWVYLSVPPPTHRIRGPVEGPCSFPGTARYLVFVKEPGSHLVCSSTIADVSRYTKCIIMKVVYFNLRRFFSCISIFFNFIKRILFRSRQRKSSRSEDDALPTLVTVASTDPPVSYDQVGNFSVLVLPFSTLL